MPYMLRNRTLNPSLILTSSPTITNVTLTLKVAAWRVTNTDANQVTYYTEADDSDPDLYSGIINTTGGYATISHTFAVKPLEFTVYAKAVASGKEVSLITSYFYSE